MDFNNPWWFPHRFWKTSLCRFWGAGNCWRGQDCMFAHGLSDLRAENSDLVPPHVKAVRAQQDLMGEAWFTSIEQGWSAWNRAMAKRRRSMADTRTPTAKTRASSASATTGSSASTRGRQVPCPSRPAKRATAPEPQEAQHLGLESLLGPEAPEFTEVHPADVKAEEPPADTQAEDMTAAATGADAALVAKARPAAVPAPVPPAAEQLRPAARSMLAAKSRLVPPRARQEGQAVEAPTHIIALGFTDVMDIYLGAKLHARDRGWLDAHQIHNLVKATHTDVGEVPDPSGSYQRFEVTVGLEWADLQDLDEYFLQIRGIFFELTSQCGNTLFWCTTGCHHSAALLSMYLLFLYHNENPDRVMAELSRRRAQLEFFEDPGEYGKYPPFAKVVRWWHQWLCKGDRPE